MAIKMWRLVVDGERATITADDARMLRGEWKPLPGQTVEELRDDTLTEICGRIPESWQVIYE